MREGVATVGEGGRDRVGIGGVGEGRERGNGWVREWDRRDG